MSLVCTVQKKKTDFKLLKVGFMCLNICILPLSIFQRFSMTMHDEDVSNVTPPASPRLFILEVGGHIPSPSDCGYGNRSDETRSDGKLWPDSYFMSILRYLQRIPAGVY